MKFSVKIYINLNFNHNKFYNCNYLVQYLFTLKNTEFMNFKQTGMAIAVAAALSFSMASCGPKDEDILKGVQEKLANAPGVTAEVKGGIVTLSGEFADDATKSSVEADVKTVKGVKSVTDNATITPPPAPAPPPMIDNDAQITTTINNALTAKKISGVTVSVANGEVTLSGNAKKSDLQTIMQIANESHPAKVNNNLTLK